MAQKPDKFPDWATEEEVDEVSGQANFVEPPDFRKESGWTRREIPPRQWFNWLARKTGLWLRWAEDRIGGLQSELDDHIPQTGGVHGIPEDERALHTGDGVNGFYKTDSTKVAWAKTGNDTAETNQDLTIFVGGDVVSVPSGTSITMPDLTVGTDYAIWCAPDGTLEADESYSVAPTTGGRRVGGFHYAPGGNASFEIDAGDGNTTPQINEYSFHDLKWKPSAPDPRGLTLVGDGAFWCGIYHLAQDHLSGPPHRHGVSPARDGNAPQLITDVGNYPDAQPMNLFEVLAYHGLRSPRVEDFQLLAFGTKEEASRGDDPVLTGLSEDNVGTENPDEVFTSHWGVIQSTGVLSHWGNDSILLTSDSTLPNPSRGGRYRAERFAHFGGSWGSDALSGSRFVSTSLATDSEAIYGSRGICDHVIIE